MNRYPDFFVIGAAKSGTTSLYFSLRQHPDVFMPEAKEPGYFCFAGREPAPADPGAVDMRKPVVFDHDSYLRLFSGARPGQLVGEATPEYLYLHQDTIRNIHETYGRLASKLKFIVVLRNPIDRLWSHYWMFRRDGWEDLPFDRAVAPETIHNRLSAGWHPSYDYVGFGRYAEQLSSWQAAFGKHSFDVILFEDLTNFTSETMAQLCEFLEIRKEPIATTLTAHNVSGKLRHPWLHEYLFRRQHGLKALARLVIPHDLLKSVKARLLAWNTEKLEMPRDVRKRLAALYREEIGALGQLIQRDLTPWYQ